CRNIMRSIAAQEVIYYATNECYTSSLTELNMAGVKSPDGENFSISATGDSYSITCPSGHGSINDGVPSWSN
ncbi:MAG: hypothetical protein KAH31_09755, partial [Candidatus Sabulitectum sp.]|nr:hypothetical protein [Candidatus Sabulitectum sp.]